MDSVCTHCNIPLVNTSVVGLDRHARGGLIDFHNFLTREDLGLVFKIPVEDMQQLLPTENA